MPYSKLKTFVTVVDLGGVHAAASALGRTPSAISQQLRSLQNELGVELLRHEAGAWVMTPAGLQMHRSVRRVLPELDAAIRSLPLKEELSGPFSVGIERGLLQGDVSERIATLCTRNPHLELSLLVASRRTLRGKMRRRELDVSLMVGAQEIPGYAIRSQVEETVCVVIHKSRLASFSHHPQITLRDRIVELEEAFTHVPGRLPVESRRSSLRACPTQLTVDGLDTCKQLAISGLGVASLPLSTVQEELAEGILQRVGPSKGTVPISWRFLTDKATAVSPQVSRFLTRSEA